jgi:energy-coupling factor transporter transmembrane protein EcfT
MTLLQIWENFPLIMLAVFFMFAVAIFAKNGKNWIETVCILLFIFCVILFFSIPFAEVSNKPDLFIIGFFLILFSFGLITLCKTKQSY